MNQGLDYAVDIVLCIDKTGSMSPVIDKVKQHALRFDGDLRDRMKNKDKFINDLRVRVIAFGDIYHDREKWLIESPFYTMPDDSDKFQSFVNGITVEGGGDEPENGLEALSIAIKSPWTSAGNRRRHVIVMWTDASAHRLEKRSEVTLPFNVESPASFDDLKDLWDSQYIGQNSRRLVLFAPESYPWSDVFNHFDEAILFPSKAGAGLADIEYGQILDMLSSSV